MGRARVDRFGSSTAVVALFVVRLFGSALAVLFT